MSLIQDVRLASRSLRSRPSYALVAILTLALGIGSTTAVFSVVDALMLRPLPYPNPDHVVDLATYVPSRRTESWTSNISLELWHALQSQRDLFDAVETYVFGQHVITNGVEPQTLSVAQLSAGALSMLGVTPELGRALVPEDATVNQGRVLLLSHRVWRERLGADPHVIGRRIDLDDVPYEIVGVMPAGFRFPWEGVRAWRPLVPATSASSRSPRTYQLVARIRANLTLEQAQQHLNQVSVALRDAGALAADRVAEFRAIRTVNDRERAPLWTLLGAVGLVLLICCANAMNLGLANASVRRREIAVSAALGASRLRIVRQLLVESLIICVIGGVAGAWLADSVVDAIAPILPIDLVFLSAHAVRVDQRVLWFALTISIASALLSGIAPALRGSRADVVEALKTGGRTQSASRGERRLHAAVAAAQCALAVMLLAGAGLLIKSFLKLQAVDPGFDTRNLLVMTLPITQSALPRYPDGASQLAFTDRLANEIRSIPGVGAVTVTGGLPPRGGGFRDANVETDASSGSAQKLTIPFSAVQSDFFRVMGIRLLAGRVFGADASPTTVVVDEVFARRFWGSPQEAVGRRFRMGPDEEWHQVVGVSADVKLMGLDDRIGGGLEFYHPFSRGPRGYAGQYEFAIRTTVPPASIASAVKQRVWQLDSKLPIYQSSEMTRLIAESLAKPRFFLLLMTIFGAVAAVIAAIGIYAVFTYSVAGRLHEMGIRRALGATAGRVARLILREGLVVSACGALIGVAGAWATSRVLTTLLFKTTPTDPAALVGGALSLVALALLACYIPARRAERVDPLVMLRIE